MNWQNIQSYKTRSSFSQTHAKLFSLLKLRLNGVTNEFSKDKETEEKLKTAFANSTT